MMNKVSKLKERPRIKSIEIVNGGQIEIKWTKVETAEKYAIKRALGDSKEFERLEWSKKCTFIDTDVPKDTTVRYIIMAYRKDGKEKASTKSSLARVAVVSDIPASEKVRAKVEDGKIFVKWKKVKGASEYIVSRKSEFYSQVTTLARTKNCEFVDEGIVPGQFYRYYVQAVVKDAEGERQGIFSSPGLAVNLDSGEILEYKASAGRKINFGLRIVSGADGYILERSEQSDGPFVEVCRTDENTKVNVCDKTPKAMKSYYYRAFSYKINKDKEFRSLPTETIKVKSR